MSASKTTPKAILEALKKALTSGPAQKVEDAYYKPRPQPFHHYNGSAWVVSTLKRSSQSQSPSSRTVRLISWNIDMLIGFAEERMSAALEHLSTLVESTNNETPIVIFLQEMSQSDMKQIRDTPFIQRRFYITDLNERNWLSPLYGTNTLIDRRLSISRVFRVPWISKFDRDGLFVDLALAEQGEGKSSVAAGLLAGDLNAIQPFDWTLHSDNNLKDVYLELGGKEDSDDGYTWGYQVPQALRERFGCSRMDKILFTGGIMPQKFERIGVGVRVAENERKEMRDAGEEEWVTDHYGVMADFQIDEESALAVTEGREDEVPRSKLT
ncbi:uncharacterized protein N0V89_009008 [Didymosphaeria variabile]|uniref:Endonuclease/exonuclease/phosphatase domain-containing protein n=1 Tax=Didymosphaeria variabile TaxID=1932322 RepID=A0A9W8XIP2_9PLEO|nr:uncharacterized protein N0V89_009008 [Didymosphaeria variabile]KAJ4350387.1 hypothetical protein N0V89_009008 [Didymosphaeria variabile]